MYDATKLISESELQGKEAHIYMLGVGGGGMCTLTLKPCNQSVSMIT